MGDNRLNLVVQFLGIDKLTPALRNIIGLGRTGRQELATLTAEQRRLTKEVGEYDKRISQTTGSVTHLWNAQKKLLTQQEAVGAQIQRQKNLMAIDGRTARMQARGSAMVGEGTQTLFWGAMLAAPIIDMAKTAGEAQGLENQLRALGLDNATVATLETNAKRAQVAGASYIDMMRYTLEAQGAFRESGEHTQAQQTYGARLMAPILGRMAFASKAMGVEMPHEQERYLLRFIEQAGGMNDPRRAAQIADGVFRALQSSGGTVQASDYQQFMAAAGTSGMKLSQRSLFADFEPLIGELHERAGTGLMSSYLRINGVGRILQQPANEMRRLGMWGGKTPGMDAGKSNLFATDPVEFYRTVMLPAYAKAGVKDVQKENALVFGRSGGMLFNLIDKQMPAILRSRGANAKAQGIDQAYNGAKNSFFGQTGQMTAAWKDFLVVAGSKGGLLQQLTNGLRMATGALQGLTAFGNANPTAFGWLLTGVSALVGMKLAGAALKIVFGGMLGPVGKLWGLWSKYRELGSIAAMFPTLARGLGIARTAMLAFDASMLLNPLVWIPAAIVAVGLLGYTIYKNWASIKGWFGGLPDWLKNIGKMMMVGLVMALDPAILVARLLSVAHAGVTAFKNYFGIKSPSRLMMEMGGHISAGLGIGVDRGAHRPLRSMSRLATGMAGALAAGTAGTAHAHASAPLTVTIHVHQRAGEDSHQLAKRIAKIVQSDRLSSYQDDF